MSKNLVYPSPTVSLKQYLEFWQDHQEWIRQVKEDQFDELLNLFEGHGLLTDADRKEFEEEFMETNRSTVNVCPGVSMHYRWDRTEALNLDDKSDALTEEIDEWVREAVRMWGAEAAWDVGLEETKVLRFVEASFQHDPRLLGRSAGHGLLNAVNLRFEMGGRCSALTVSVSDHGRTRAVRSRFKVLER